mmetsp:Transcript_24053/g.38521  ORF Transcript_24053/g.38521 Transcript_24053/m.38521 type:complete len:1274 (-) Transcript_24053:63-3884(-)
MRADARHTARRLCGQSRLAKELRCVRSAGQDLGKAVPQSSSLLRASSLAPGWNAAAAVARSRVPVHPDLGQRSALHQLSRRFLCSFSQRLEATQIRPLPQGDASFLESYALEDIDDTEDVLPMDSTGLMPLWEDPDQLGARFGEPAGLPPSQMSPASALTGFAPTHAPPPPQRHINLNLAPWPMLPPPPSGQPSSASTAPPRPPQHSLATPFSFSLQEELPPGLGLPLPLSLTRLEGPVSLFSSLQAHLRKIERGELALQTVPQVHLTLENAGYLEARFLQDNIRRYLDGAENEAIASLDTQLLACHGILLEDLSLEMLESFAKNPGVLMPMPNPENAPAGENALLADPDSLESFATDGRFSGGGVEEVRRQLYGKNRFPILLPEAEGRGILSGLAVSDRRRQLVVERVTQSFALQEYLEMQQKTEEDGRGASTGSKMRIWTPWVKAIAAVLNDSDAKVMRGKGANAQKLLRSLGCEAELLGVITCQTVLNLILLPSFRHKDEAKAAAGAATSGQVPFVTAVVTVGEAVELEKWWREEVGSRPRSKGARAEQDRASLMASLLGRQRASQGWQEASQTVPVGSALVDLLIDWAYLPVDRSSLTSEELLHAREMKPQSTEQAGGELPPELNPKIMVKAFVHGLRREGKKTVGYIALNPAARSHLHLEEADLMSFIQPKLQPMVHQPRPWQPCGDRPEGGYLLHKVPFIRTTNQSLTNLRSYSAKRVAKVMDFVGCVPWQINRDILALMQEAKRRNLGIAEVPSNDDPEVPPFPQAEELQLMTEQERSALMLKRHNAQKKFRELQSERPTFMLKLRVAEDFASASRLYFPHSVDFRGRAYPVPPHLNHIGCDICRGLLMFADAKPLGEHGLYWMKVNCANLFGKNKIPFAERVAWVDEQKDWIMEVVKDPLAPGNVERWSNADDGPWQALARCIELAAVWQSEDPPEAFLSRLPIHLDGSCNGLQHYAALGRDEFGGKAVNLSPSDRPQDVYTVVLEIVKQKVAKDAAGPKQAHEDEEDLEKRAALEAADPGHLANRLVELEVLKRKVVKQTIMTICYGVTVVGAKKQVQSQLEDMVGQEVDPKEISKLAAYLSKLVMKSIDEVFERAMLIKRWFDQISKELNQLEVPTSWQSPIGLACVQPYKKPVKVHVNTKRQKVTLVTGDGPLMDKNKQRMGFPPNFIHSLDATHMMMTAEGCQRRGIQFAGVHDSFWTHACDAPVLAEIIREAFIELHGQPLLEDLMKDLRVHLGGIEPPPLPKQGDLDLCRVRESKYIFN